MHDMPSSFAEFLISQPCFIGSQFPDPERAIYFVDSRDAFYVYLPKYQSFWIQIQARPEDSNQARATDPKTILRLVNELEGILIADAPKGEAWASPIFSSLDSLYSLYSKTLQSTTKHTSSCRMAFGRLDLSCPRCIELSQGG